MTDIDLVAACATTYVQPPTLPVPMTGVDCRITVAADGAMIVAFRGSVTAEDWARDFICAPIADREHPQLGLCHAGFLDGAESIVEAVSLSVGGASALYPLYVTGHSLGGALALGVGALLALAKRPPAAIVTFGAPRFGMEKFVDALRPIPVRQYRRGNDVVPLVPFDVPPDLMWCDVCSPLIAIGQPQRDFLSCHHIAGYVDDVTALLQKRAA